MPSGREVQTEVRREGAYSLFLDTKSVQLEDMLQRIRNWSHGKSTKFVDDQIASYVERLYDKVFGESTHGLRGCI